MKKISLASDTISKKELFYLSKWINKSPKLTMGDRTIEFERKWSKWLGMKYSVYLNSGSSAILASFQSFKEMKKFKNNKIVIPALCWSTDFSSLAQLGFETIICDCNLRDLSVSLLDLEKIFKNYRPSALLLVSVLGLVPDMKSILNLCKKYKVTLIEDACESLGSEYNGKKLGTFGFCSFFSLYYGHHISTIEGGVVSTNNRDFYNILLSVRSHGWSRNMENIYRKKLEKKFHISDFESSFTFYYRGFNFRPTEIQAFLGLMQLKKLKKIIQRRFSNFKYFMKKLKKISWKPSVNFKKSIISNMGLPVISAKRDEIIKQMSLNSIESRPLISGSLNQQPFFRNHSINKNKLPNSHRVHKYGFYLPNHFDIKKKDIDKIVKILESF